MDEMNAPNPTGVAKGTANKISQRLSDPLLGSLTLWFLIFNWDIIAVVIFEGPTFVTVALAKTVYWSEYLCRLVLPLAIGTGMFFVWPLADWGLAWYLAFFNQKKTFSIQKIKYQDVAMQANARESALLGTFAVIREMEAIEAPEKFTFALLNQTFDKGDWIYKVDNNEYRIARPDLIPPPIAEGTTAQLGLVIDHKYYGVFPHGVSISFVRCKGRVPATLFNFNLIRDTEYFLTETGMATLEELPVLKSGFSLGSTTSEGEIQFEINIKPR
jgi:hypothetical protein